MSKCTCSKFPWMEFLSLVLTLLLVFFCKLDYFIVAIAAIETFLIGARWGRDPQYFKRYIFWRKGVHEAH